ncbi:GNAT family protein [Intrasporangium sp.]|uniref:GNAT family N-acetyltransferase n=1 Tax=Intrasporangium sp. TaxID=1925024 RepID=UPI00293ABB2C|nr:GNAT family protein [Intrasporangium sp.]MDV3222574.1 GNAT family N-acetyltransferase [Intrasporangium sp.]
MRSPEDVPPHTDVVTTVRPARGQGRPEVEALVNEAFDGGADLVVWRAPVGDWEARRVAWSLGFTFAPRALRVDGARARSREEWLGWLGREEAREPRSRWLEPVVLEASRVRLRPWRAEDATRLVEAATDAVFQTMLPHSPLPQRVEDVPGYLERLRLMEANGTRVAWCVADRETDLALGNVALFEFDTDEPDGTAQVGYWAHPEGRGRGAMSAAVDLASSWSMRSQDDGGLGLRRLFLLTAVSNVPSQRLAVRAGFVRVGTERLSAETADGGWEDNALYDRLRD